MFRYRNGRFRHYAAKQGLLNPHVGTIFEDSHCNLWVGTWGGLFRFKAGRFKRVEGPNALRSRILSLCEDRQGNLWVGGNSVVRLGPRGATVFGSREGMGGHNIRGITVDRDGSVWVASFGSGLFHQTGGRFVRDGARKWAGETKVRALYVDDSDALWIATWGEGLYRLKDGRFTHWTTSEGVPSEMIHAIIEDKAGNLWFSSDNGFFGCPQRQFQDYVPGRSLPLLFWHLTMADGLESPMGSGAGELAVTRSADGQLRFPNQPTPAIEPEEQLTARESEVLSLAARGFSSKEMADHLAISPRTVCLHLQHIYRKLHVRSRTEAAAKWFESHPPRKPGFPGKRV